MGLSGCIVFIAVGAILTFATDWEAQGVDLDVVGLILMAVGFIGAVAFTSIARRRRGGVGRGAPRGRRGGGGGGRPAAPRRLRPRSSPPPLRTPR
ncbi:hypothetical protein ACFV0R_07455, partial [Streptomyces sp. NPDC059578]|uniref:hypothetical protein n=1 Tax=Streptomyces sp. NPDC059578 TaxID=3346874 RepID=UPI00368ECC45